MKKGDKTKARMLETARQLFQRQGYHATGLNQILSESQCPKGSLYFHFPGGKEELASKSIDISSDLLEHQKELLLSQASSFSEAMAWVCGIFIAQLEDSDFESGCPVASLTMEMASNSEKIQKACWGYYTRWVEAVQDLLVHFGVEQSESKELATFILSSVEGALLLCQAQQSKEPLLIAASHLSRFVEGCIQSSAPAPSA